MNDPVRPPPVRPTGSRPDLPDHPRARESRTGRKTIVGGRPPGEGEQESGLGSGIDTLLRKAASDPRFRADLLARRSEVAEQAGVTLTHVERVVLDGAPADQLAAIAEAMPPEAPPPGGEVERREVVGPAGGALADDPELWARYGPKPRQPAGLRFLAWLLGALGVLGVVWLLVRLWL